MRKAVLAVNHAHAECGFSTASHKLLDKYRWLGLLIIQMLLIVLPPFFFFAVTICCALWVKEIDTYIWKHMVLYISLHSDINQSHTPLLHMFSSSLAWSLSLSSLLHTSVSPLLQPLFLIFSPHLPLIPLWRFLLPSHLSINTLEQRWTGRSKHPRKYSLICSTDWGSLGYLFAPPTTTTPPPPLPVFVCLSQECSSLLRVPRYKV